MTLLAAFFAWLNFQAAESIYDSWANPAMLYRSDYFPKQEYRKTDPITATLYLAAAFGLLSGFAFAASASTVIHSLRIG